MIWSKVPGGLGDLQNLRHRTCAKRDEAVKAVLSRHLGHAEFPCLFLDAACLKVRNRLSPVTSTAIVVASGVAEDGCGGHLGYGLGDSETEGFRQQFPVSRRDRGLTGARLAAAANRALQGAARQRCRMYFARDLLAPRGPDPQHMAAAILWTVFAQPDAAAVREARGQVSEQLAAMFPKTGERAADAKAEAPAFTAFPNSHRQKIWSTNPLERINKKSNAAHG